MYIIIRNIAGQCPPRPQDPPRQRQQICLSDKPGNEKKRKQKKIKRMTRLLCSAVEIPRGEKKKKRLRILIIIYMSFSRTPRRHIPHAYYYFIHHNRHQTPRYTWSCVLVACRIIYYNNIIYIF
jgi:hypothetical protein